jgi:hypothetical protein
MTIDHFRPKARFPHLRTEYSNLYYCCCECNTYKGDRWPSDDELSADLRFVDVCEDEWDDHLELRQDVITPKTAPGKFTAASLRLDRQKLTLRNHALRTRAARIRQDLTRLASIRAQLPPDVGPSTAGHLNELERSLNTDLQEVLSPQALEG